MLGISSDGSNLRLRDKNNNPRFLCNSIRRERHSKNNEDVPIGGFVLLRNSCGLLDRDLCRQAAFLGRGHEQWRMPLIVCGGTRGLWR